LIREIPHGVGERLPVPVRKVVKVFDVNCPVAVQAGMTVIVPTKAAHRSRARKLSSRQGPEAERIDALLDTPDGAALYRRRQHMIEPVFANTKSIRGITRFRRRGLAACQAEWKLIAATHKSSLRIARTPRCTASRASPA
jgi:hypothetical protein